MRRYLMFISYVGTAYKGIAKQKGCEIKTVIGSLEKALECIQPANSVHVVASSRTDKGVHALCNSIQVDLQHRKDGYEFDPSLITFAANQMLYNSDEQIRVLQTRTVPNEFHCRHHATGRSYVYRIQIPKNPSLHSFFLPYSTLELDRIYTISGPVDMDLVHAAAERLSGEHDFSAFTTLGGLREKQFQRMTKAMKVTIEPGRLSFQEHMDLYNECYNVWDFKFHSKSYLYHQVRHMTGVLLAVGRGLMKLDTVTDMLVDPMKYHQHSPPLIHSTVYGVPAGGLYLAQVHYDKKDLQIETEEGDKPAKLFNPIRQLQDNEYAYKYVLKTENFVRIHRRLLDPDSDLVESLLTLYKKGKPSKKAYKYHQAAMLKKDRKSESTNLTGEH